MAADAAVLQQQDISIHNADSVPVAPHTQMITLEVSE